MKKKFMGKVMDFIGLGEDEEELEFEDMEDDEEIEPYIPISNKGKIVNIQTNSNVKVVLVEPLSFNDAPQICDNLKNRKTIVVNLEKADHEEARKVFDFLNGAVYALDGKIQKIANGVFILAPNNVDILSEIGEEIKNKSLFNWPNK
ncbi:cell division protein SepF [Irregularibacter muris]|uniref:Cell division protein SepF n=1 Tax=Irregularibacter muris TaxID=1796619 RepID=A0AAE3L3F8_9FIRM|nr:cell division protein SepF [Irregularibacter muris]MCR1898188.1 cell division protein SepF [Irregularibacter muris]